MRLLIPLLAAAMSLAGCATSFTASGSVSELADRLSTAWQGWSSVDEAEGTTAGEPVQRKAPVVARPAPPQAVQNAAPRAVPKAAPPRAATTTPSPSKVKAQTVTQAERLRPIPTATEAQPLPASEPAPPPPVDSVASVVATVAPIPVVETQLAPTAFSHRFLLSAAEAARLGYPQARIDAAPVLRAPESWREQQAWATVGAKQIANRMSSSMLLGIHVGQGERELDAARDLARAFIRAAEAAGARGILFVIPLPGDATDAKARRIRLLLPSNT